jgi:hypothetical protein
MKVGGFQGHVSAKLATESVVLPNMHRARNAFGMHRNRPRLKYRGRNISAVARVRIVALIGRIGPNTGALDLAQASWVAFGYVQFAPFVSHALRAGLAARTAALCKDTTSESATKRGGDDSRPGRKEPVRDHRAAGAAVEHDAVLSLLYAAGNLNLSSAGLYTGLSHLARKCNFTVDEVVRVGVRFAMSIVSEQTAPAFEAVVRNVKPSDCERMKGPQVGGLLFALSKCGVIDQGHDRLVEALIDRLKGRARRMETRHAVMATVALVRSAAHRRPDVLLELCSELHRRDEWGKVPLGMLSALVPALAAPSDAQATSTVRPTFIAFLQAQRSAFPPRTCHALRRALAEHADRLPGATEVIAKLQQNAASDPDDLAPGGATLTSSTDVDEGSSRAGGGGLVRRWVGDLDEAFLHRNSPRVDATLRRLRAVRSEWDQLDARGLASFARVLSKLPNLPPGDLSSVLELAAKRCPTMDPVSGAYLIRAMGRTNFRRAEWSAAFLEAVVRGNSASPLTTADRVAVLAALVRQRHLPMQSALEVLRPASRGEVDVPKSPLELIDYTEGTGPIACVDATFARNALKAREAWLRTSFEGITSPHLLVRGVVALARVGATASELRPWLERLAAGHGTLHTPVTAADARAIAILAPLLPEGTPIELVSGLVHQTRKRSVGTLVQNLHSVASSLCLHVSTNEVGDEVDALRAAFASHHSPQVYPSAIPSCAIVAGGLKLAATTDAHREVSKAALRVVRNTFTSVFDSEDDMAVTLAALAPLSRDGSLSAGEVWARTASELVRPAPTDHTNRRGDLTRTCRVPLTVLGLRALCKALSGAPAAMTLASETPARADIFGGWQGCGHAARAVVVGRNTCRRGLVYVRSQ